MANIFGRNPQALGGVFLSDFGKLSFGANISAALVQNINMTFRQTINRLYEIGTDGPAAPGAPGDASKVYYVGGRMEGTLTIARVIGPSQDVKSFYSTFGCICVQGKEIILDLAQGNCLAAAPAAGAAGPCAVPPAGGLPLKYVLKDCVITQVGLTLAAQDMLINENVQLMFTNVDMP